MTKSLRAKLAASHILPIFVLMPVLSLYLLYTLEGFFTESLLRQLTYQAQLVRDQMQPEQDWETPESAQNFLARVAQLTDASVVVLSKESTILALTRMEYAERIGTLYSDSAVSQALRGESAQGVGPGFTTDVAYVVLPLQHNGETDGALRLSYRVDDLRSQFTQLQWLILGGVVFTALLGLVLGWGLATTITRPLRQLSQSAQEIAAGNYHARAPVPSRDEVGTLAMQFNRMAARLEEAEQARVRQLAAIVHELARPLAGIEAAVETLREDADLNPEMRDTLLAGLEEQVARFDRMVDTLKGLHKRALRPMHLSRAEISLERVIRASVANFEPAAARNGIALTVEIPSHLPKIRADADRLIQVLTNLLDNAFKFTPRHGKITVRAVADARTVGVSVTDTGVGVAPDELPHIFQQFYRGDESRPPEKSGMGLGLAISREIIAAHHGQIEVESRPGGGACFKFSLPIG